MKLTRVIRFRATEEEEQRLIALANQTGGTVSDVLRQLLSSAELEPYTTFRPISRLPGGFPQQQTKNDAGVRQDVASAAL